MAMTNRVRFDAVRLLIPPPAWGKRNALKPDKTAKNTSSTQRAEFGHEKAPGFTKNNPLSHFDVQGWMFNVQCLPRGTRGSNSLPAPFLRSTKIFLLFLKPFME
jgi:hypothetical protein